MGLAHEKKSYLQEKANLFEIGSKINRGVSGNNRQGIPRNPGEKSEKKMLTCKYDFTCYYESKQSILFSFSLLFHKIQNG